MEVLKVKYEGAGILFVCLRIVPSRDDQSTPDADFVRTDGNCPVFVNPASPRACNLSIRQVLVFNRYTGVSP